MLNNEERQLLVASILNGQTKEKKKIQQMLIKQMIVHSSEDGHVDDDSFELVVEEALKGKVLSLRKARKLLEESGVFTCEKDGCWCYNSNRAERGETVSWEDLKKVFSTRKSLFDELSENNCKEAIIKGISWMLRMVLEAKKDGRIEGLPAFYSCDGEVDHIIGFNSASTATSDALSLICQVPEYLKECGLESIELIDCFVFLINKTMRCQCKIEGWDFGGFYPFEDQPESMHPTVDGTCIAIMALGIFYERKETIEKALNIQISVERDVIEESILSGIDFLFRMQLKDGSFGIYRYQNDTPETRPNENCTRMVQSAMGVSKECGVFDRDDRASYYSSCSAVIEKTYAYLKENRTEARNNSFIWSPYFGKKASDYRPEDNIVSTARVCRSFIPVWWQKEEERECICQYHRDFLTYWKEHVNEAYENIGLYRFNSPAESSFSVGEYQWNSRPDILAAFSVIQAYNLFGLTLDLNDWHMVEDAVYHTLQLQHPHGHWDNPVGERTPFCAVTLAAIELIDEYRRARFGE